MFYKYELSIKTENKTGREQIVKEMKENPTFFGDGILSEDYIPFGTMMTFPSNGAVKEDEIPFSEVWEDMINLSKAFPNAIFRLLIIKGVGQDIWFQFFKNGKVEASMAKISCNPKFDW